MQRATLSRPPPLQDHLRKTRAFNVTSLTVVFHFQRTERSIQAHVLSSAAFPTTASKQKPITNMHLTVILN